MRSVRGFFTLVLAVAVFALPILTGMGQPALADPSDLTVGGVVWGRIMHDAGGYTAAQRINFVRERITNVLSIQRFNSSKTVFVNATAMGSSAVITVGDLTGGPTYLVVTVTPQDAMGQTANAHQLASQWATNLIRGLNNAMPASHWNVKQ